jgi:hypothetical protein
MFVAGKVKVKKLDAKSIYLCFILQRRRRPVDIPQLRLNDNSLTSRNGAVYTAFFAFIFVEFRPKNKAISPRRRIRNKSFLFGSCVQ